MKRGAYRPRESNSRRHRLRATAVCTGAIVVLTMTVIVAEVACGGTTGREGMSTAPVSSDAAVDGTVIADADDTIDEGLFDVAIAYADRVLPDVQPIADAGPIDWPNCPQDLGIDSNGNVTDIEHGAYDVAATYDDAGNAVPAPDGSVCATHVWLGRKEWDDCIRVNATVAPSLPPCNGVIDAGAARRGPRTGESLFTLCQELSQCIVKTGCGLNDVDECLCGVGNASYPDCKAHGLIGPCAMEELAALQIDPTDPAALDTAINNYIDTNPSSLYAAAGPLNQLYSLGKTFDCFVPVDAGAD